MRLTLLATALIALAVASPTSARDTVLHLESRYVVDPAYAKQSLDGSVHFYFEGEATPAVLTELGEANTSRKTNAAGKSDDKACEWAMLSALVALQAQAKSLGANAVVGITSNYNQKPWSSATQYECHAGSLMAGVALKGRYAKVDAR